MRIELFHGVLAAGLLFAAGIVWADATSSQRQTRRAREAGFASVRLDIPRISCALCREEIVHALRRKPGVAEITADRRGATVAFDAAQVSPESLAQVVRGTGYDATVREVEIAPVRGRVPRSVRTGRPTAASA